MSESPSFTGMNKHESSRVTGVPVKRQKSGGMELRASGGIEVGRLGGGTLLIVSIFHVPLFKASPMVGQRQPTVGLSYEVSVLV